MIEQPASRGGADDVRAPQTTPPLIALLGASNRRFAAEVTQRLRNTPYPELALSDSTNVLRWLHDGPKTSIEIVNRSGVTKQAISQHVRHLMQIGLVELIEHPTDGRARLVRLTRSGRNAQRTVHRLFVEIESEWRAQLGDDDWDIVTSALTRFAGLSSERLPPP